MKFPVALVFILATTKASTYGWMDGFQFSTSREFLNVYKPQQTGPPNQQPFRHSPQYHQHQQAPSPHQHLENANQPTATNYFYNENNREAAAETHSSEFHRRSGMPSQGHANYHRGLEEQSHYQPQVAGRNAFGPEQNSFVNTPEIVGKFSNSTDGIEIGPRALFSTPVRCKSIDHRGNCLSRG